jgi:hypothetical protein
MTTVAVDKYKELIKGGADAYFLQLMAVGWLNDWHEDDIDLLRLALAETSASEESREYLVFCLSEFRFSPYISGIEDYKAFLLDLSGNFSLGLQAKDINVLPMGEDIVVSISTPNGDVGRRLAQDDESMLSEDLFDFINDDLLPILGEDKEFYILPPADEYLEAVFIDPEVLDKAYDAGIIPDDEYFS